MKFGVVILALSATAMAYESLTPRDEGLAPRDGQCLKNGEKCRREDTCCSKFCIIWENMTEGSCTDKPKI
ncbi:hypothetical protein X797_004495 [Metarhizium robertsii]|uniref:Gurmarin/antimicrobial peptide n=2 Tax=Metarhizium robertsii TaxID=568076 RepID=E9ETA7_METRA|nr:Gurmarin/antimicrobial peptide [Metarhizium robertsii ARSEF 23]EFZ01872.2 Gurmarin/antimicrobial peptide [Metarhizium robertsii ARSEF 23]EXV02365.1 hypothetical protein X797_004495 [Metarhizium robertsii]